MWVFNRYPWGPLIVLGFEHFGTTKFISCIPFQLKNTFTDHTTTDEVISGLYTNEHVGVFVIDEDLV